MIFLGQEYLLSSANLNAKCYDFLSSLTENPSERRNQVRYSFICVFDMKMCHVVGVFCFWKEKKVQKRNKISYFCTAFMETSTFL